MKKYILSPLFCFILLFSRAQNQTIIFNYNTTGRITGDVLQVRIFNMSFENTHVVIKPFVIPEYPGFSGLIIPEKQIIMIPAGEVKTFFLKGYCLNPEKTFIPKDIFFESGSFITYGISYSPDGPGTLRIPMASLTSSDFLLTVPGTYDLLLRNYLRIKNEDYGKRFSDNMYYLLLDEITRLNDAYDKLYTAGKVFTQFNNDPIFEKQTIIQLAVWLCYSELQGCPFRKKHLMKALSDYVGFFESSGGELDLKSSRPQYIRLMERMGREAMVFITPQDLEQVRERLPNGNGRKISPISENLPSSMLGKKLDEIYCIRNQAVLAKNTCLPCILEKQNAALDIWLLNISIQQQLMASKTDNMWTNKAENLRDSMMALLKSEPNTQIFILPNDTMQKFLNQFFSAYSDIKDYLSKYDPGKLYYSFDCCNGFNSTNFSDLADKLNTLQKLISLTFDSELFITPHITDLNAIQIANSLQLRIQLLRALQELCSVFVSFGRQAQDLCLKSETPYFLIDALQIFNKFYNTNLSDAVFKDFQLQIPLLNERDSVINNLNVRFGNCNCGQPKEASFPVIISEPGKLVLKSDSFIKKPLKVWPRFEIGLDAGYSLPDAAGADKFSKGGISMNRVKDLGFDSAFFNYYGEGYQIMPQGDFRFTNNFYYRLRFSYSPVFTINPHLILTKAKMNAVAEFPVSYLPDPSDTVTRETDYGKITSFIDLYGFDLSLRIKVINFRHSNLFLEPGIGKSFYSNTFTSVTNEGFGFELPGNVRAQTFHSSISAGIRTFINPDFYIELFGRYLRRNDKNIAGSQVKATDISFGLGSGLRF